ncbi:hypothetical protein Acr_09g0003250 [Actinidia rufa]|uniref:CCHC-type domain-containing protein n=1 Tax=Actinidia rufa TaxID=165716 RepID=A0A7J0F6Q0_9ERIC|nr:hypothetical protein Acr_09g0003250 [Actinidia rufa]
MAYIGYVKPSVKVREESPRWQMRNIGNIDPFGESPRNAIVYRDIDPFGESPRNAIVYRDVDPFGESPRNAIVYRDVDPFGESPRNAIVYRDIDPFGESPRNAMVYRDVDPFGKSPRNVMVYRDVDPFGESPRNATNMPPHQARVRARLLTGARGACVEHGARENRDEGDNDNHHGSAMEGEANAFSGNVWIVGGAPPTVVSGTKFMQGVFTAIEQVVRNTVQEMLVPARAVDTRTVIREGVNETWRITHPKSQREGTSAQSEGHFSKKPKSSMLLDQTSRGGPICFGCHQSGHRVAGCPLKGQKRQSRQGGCSRGLAQEQLPRRNTQGALDQKGQRTQGRAYAVTSAVGPSETAGQQEQ